MLTTIVAVLALVVGMGATRSIYRLRLGYRCVRCGVNSHGWTLCLECHVEERNKLGSREG